VKEEGEEKERKRKLPAEPNGRRVLSGTPTGCEADYFEINGYP
jgi:hypothetical protein